jgi:hypothetical protein
MDPPPAGQYRMRISGKFPVYPEELVQVNPGTIITINDNDVGNPFPQSSLVRFGDKQFLVYLGHIGPMLEPVVAPVVGAPAAGGRRKTRKQKSSRKSRRVRRRN